MVGNDWDTILGEEWSANYFRELCNFVREEREKNVVYPPESNVFTAFRLTPYEQVKVVILGQDPYHGEGQAEGLAFSVPEGIVHPPSLRNIFKELESDLGPFKAKGGSLRGWAEQGVLLLNAILTVGAGSPSSHEKKGWERFTDRVVEALNRRQKPAVFILWGKYAEAKGAKIDRRRHLVITSAHPSPLSARHGFFGSRPFSQTNRFLTEIGSKEINWLDI